MALAKERPTMGTWDTGNWDNDNACDWLFELGRSPDLKALRQVLSPPKGFLDAEDAELVLAGAEIVAAGLGQPHAQLPQRAGEWLRKHSDLDFASLVPQAREHIARVVAHSELKERWQDAERLDDWLRQVNDLAARLAR